MKQINHNCPAVRMIDETLKSAFKLCERVARSVDWGFESKAEKKAAQAWLRGLLIETIFQAGDQRQAAILKCMPRVRGIWKKEFAKAKLPPHRQGCPTWIKLMCAAQAIGKYATKEK